MSKNIRTEAVDHLFEAILCLKDKEECYTFFEDVCTINELLSQARDLILNNQMGVAEAAYEVGYVSASQFSREFKRLFGVPPKLSTN